MLVSTYFAQQATGQNDTIKVKYILQEISQKGFNAKENGVYRQVVNANQTKISAGDSLIINYFITGYGYIDFKSSKLYYSSSSSEIINSKKSIVKSGLYVNDSLIIYGAYDFPFYHIGGLYLNSNVVSTSGAISATYFDDFHNAYPEKKYLVPIKVNKSEKSYQYPGPLVYSEVMMGVGDITNYLPPVQFKLHINNDAKPGDYYLSFVLTYFNGKNWMSDRVEIQYTVMEWYERYASQIQWLALTIAFLTIITLFRPTIKEIKFYINTLLKIGIKRPKPILNPPDLENEPQKDLFGKNKADGKIKLQIKPKKVNIRKNRKKK